MKTFLIAIFLLVIIIFWGVSFDYGTLASQKTVDIYNLAWSAFPWLLMICLFCYYLFLDVKIPKTLLGLVILSFFFSSFSMGDIISNTVYAPRTGWDLRGLDIMFASFWVLFIGQTVLAILIRNYGYKLLKSKNV